MMEQLNGNFGPPLKPPSIDNFVEDEPVVNPHGFFNELSYQNACSVRVAVRVRPLIGREMSEGGRTCVDVSHDENKLMIGEKQYQFDRVFSSEDTQQEIFDVCSRNLVLGCFAGYNATIIAYGQTGSGKTHTMGTGTTNGLDESNIGIVPRVFQFIFEELDRKKKQSSLSEFTIKISFLELYNEELHDLLDIGVIDRITGKPTKDLQIKEKNGSISVHGIKEETVQSKEECIELLNKGINHRTTSATLMNEGSSRSHAIFTISIEQKIVKEIEVPEGVVIENKGGLPGQQEELITAKFHFVDLAGSERLKRTGATGKLMQEGISINKGLLCLGNVISALTDEHKKDKHIPYRDSKLTRILQDSLGGNSRTTVIACVSPAESNYEESLNSIKYASRARNIKNKAVVNRDPNSLLIDSLRQQISQCKSEIFEYQRILKDNSIEIPQDFSESVKKRLEQTQKSPSRPSEFTGDSPSKGLNAQEVNQFKIQLHKKEENLKQLNSQLSELTQSITLRDAQFEELQKERDHLKIKTEILVEHCQKNNIAVDLPSDQTLSLIDEYKLKLETLKKEFEQKSQEANQKQSKIEELQKTKTKDDKLLQQYNEEIQKLKAQIRKQDSNQSPVQSLRIQQQMAKNFKLNLQNITNPEKAVPNFTFDAEDINKKIIDSMTSQLDSLFSTHADEEPLQVNRSPRRSKTPVKPIQEDDADPNQIVKPFTAASEDEPAAVNEQENKILMEEKQKILSIAMEGFHKLQSEYEEMAKHRYNEQARQTETVMRNMDSEKQATLKKTTDSKQIQIIEMQHKAKMDELAKQLATFKEKEKQQEMMAKQISMRESKIKNLEDDIGKMRKTTENLEKKLKTEQDKSTEYKITAQKEISQTKKVLSEKEKEVLKLKEDLVKRDQVMHSKLEEMKLQQKKQYEERLKRELEKGEEESKYSMDIDRIKVWIQTNTDRMLRQRELLEMGDKHIMDMEIIEVEMEEEAERLTQLTIERDRKTIELEELVAIAESSEEPDEGPIAILEEEIYQLTAEIDRIEELLSTKEEKYNYLIQSNEETFKEGAELGFKSIEPLKFQGLKSVESAKLTLEVFFDQLLNLNFQKRDLEKSNISQVEQILDMSSKVSAMQTQIYELSTKLQNQACNFKTTSAVETQPTQISASDRVAQATKDKALKTIINSMEGYVEYDNVKNLGLKPNEMNSLTKLSLSKIVSNHKQQLEEEKKRNHNLVLKLELALSEKEAMKLKYDNLKKKAKDDAYFKDPLQQSSQSVQPQTEQKAQFQSLAAVRASRRGNNQQQSNNPLNKLQNDIDKAKEILQTTPNAQNKYKSRIGTKPNDETEALAKRFKHPSTIIPATKKPSFNLGNNSSAKKQAQSRSNSRDSEQRQKQQVPSFMSRTKASANQVVTKKPVQTQQSATGPTLKQRILPQVPQFVQSEEPVQILDDHQYSVQNKPRMNLQDRRNQRKVGTNMDNNGERQMNEEIDKIKETTQLITSGQSHQLRQQSRAREYSKKIQNERALSSGRFNQSGLQNSNGSFDMTNLKDLQEDDNEDSPRNHQSSNGYGQEEDGYGEEQVMEPNTAVQQWNYEELAQLENEGSRLIGCECMNGSIVLFFENFKVRVIDLYTFEEREPIYLLQQNNLKDLGENAVDVAVDKELEAFAIATPTFVYIFDFTYQYQAQIQVESIERVLFCQYHIVVMVNAGDSAYFICYQLEDQTEVGCFDMKTDDNKVIIKTDNNYVYLACGIKLVKLSVPELQQVFLYESEHEASIIDMTISSQCIITTSLDKSVRVHQIDSGEQCMNSLNNADCDHLESCEDFVFARLQEGASVVVFRYYESAQDLSFINEVDLRDIKEAMGQIIDFKMQGNILAKLSPDPNAPSYQIILLVTVIQECIVVNALKYKPLSEI